ncbi:MAG: thiamine-phosphate kinase [Thermoplasmata archaeon]|nr:thiamine-phosphate kinase [Thermoplasmata archaeon]
MESPPGVLLPIGDDAAAVAGARRGPWLLTTDAFSEGYHFFADSPPRAVGRALVGVNASDLAAKGGRPVAFLLDLLMPPGTPAEWSRQVVRGVREELRRIGAPLVGGDAKPAACRVLVGTFLGEASSSRLAPRSGARTGDLLLLTGSVGRAGWAAQRMIRSRGATRLRAHRALLEITPRLAEGELLVRYAHAMLDTSDGFAEAARLLASASHRQVLVEEEALPFDPVILNARLTHPERLRLSAYGGEYELLAAIPPSSLAVVRRGLGRLSCPFRIIGRVETGRGAWLLRDGRCVPLPASSWQPWKGPSGVSLSRGRTGYSKSAVADQSSAIESELP